MLPTKTECRRHNTYTHEQEHNTNATIIDKKTTLLMSINNSSRNHVLIVNNVFLIRLQNTFKFSMLYYFKTHMFNKAYLERALSKKHLRSNKQTFTVTKHNIQIVRVCQGFNYFDKQTCTGLNV